MYNKKTHIYTNNILVAIGVICLVDHPLLLLKFNVIIISSLLKKKKVSLFLFPCFRKYKRKNSKKQKNCKNVLKIRKRLANSVSVSKFFSQK